MKKYRYYRFTKQAVWTREIFDIEADSKNEADTVAVTSILYGAVEPWDFTILDGIASDEDGIGSYFIEDEECKVVSRGVEA